MGEEARRLFGILGDVLVARATSRIVARESIAYRIGNAVLTELKKRGLEVDDANVDEMARLAGEMTGLVADMSEGVQAAVSRLVELAKEQEFIKGVYLVTSGSPFVSAVLMLPAPREKWMDGTELLGTWALEIPQSNAGVADLVHNAKVIALGEWDRVRKQGEILPLWERTQDTSEK